jgi:hypothetical protein
LEIARGERLGRRKTAARGGVQRALWALFPVFQNIDQEVLVGRVDGDTVRRPKEMADLGIFWILHIVFDGLAFFNGGVQT